jgi:hypothetical protein
MASCEAGAVQAGQANVVKGKPGGQTWHGPHAMARGALPLGVTGCAEIARAGGSCAVLANPVAVMDHMIVGRCALPGEINVASVAVAKRPFVTVLVAAEASSHLRQHRVWTRLGDLDMAVNAVALRGEHVARVCETELRACEIDGLSDVRLAVASLAGSLVVRLLVAAAAGGIRRKV